MYQILPVLNESRKGKAILTSSLVEIFQPISKNVFGKNIISLQNLLISC